MAIWHLVDYQAGGKGLRLKGWFKAYSNYWKNPVGGWMPKSDKDIIMATENVVSPTLLDWSKTDSNMHPTIPNRVYEPSFINFIADRLSKEKIKQKFDIYKELPTGWLDRQGRLYKCNPREHDDKAYELGFTVGEIEDLGWVRCHGDIYRIPNIRLSAEQRNKLCSLGYAVDEDD